MNIHSRTLLKTHESGESTPKNSPKKKPAEHDSAEKSSKEKPGPSLYEKLRQRPWLVAGIVAGIVLILLIGLLWWLHARQYESTDDAFVDARAVAISSQVNGAIVSVPVTDNQDVESGNPLVVIDDRDYRAALDQANAKEAQDQASLKNAQTDLGRTMVLAKQDFATKQLLDTQKSSVDQLSATIKGDAAMIEQAKTNLDRTKIIAPTAGRVTKLTAAKGAYASVGQVLMMFVPKEIWITANFKETQLTYMRPGQPVEVSIDAYPSRTFKAHVDSIQTGSGVAFSVLPPENATGNFVKVVQRVPVKIVFDEIPDVTLGPGMSVVPTVKVR
jgi:membrane fusion protein (multidrug efflux system)